MSHGLDRIKWNNEGETMSHPPETSLSSLELAVEIANQLGGAEMLQGPYLDIVPIVEKLIDAWVRLKEARLTDLIQKWRSKEWEDSHMAELGIGVLFFPAHACADELESAIATARKLEEKL